MESTIELKKDGITSLVVWRHSLNKTEFVICNYYDATREIGDQWSSGHYYDDLNTALLAFDSKSYF